MATLWVWITGSLVAIVCFLLFFYVYSTWNYGIFKKMGVNGPQPSFLFGNHMVFAKHGFKKADMMLWKEYGDVFGYFTGRTPSIVIADTEILQEILVKQFNNFTDRAVLRGFSGAMNENLSAQQGKVWKSSRSILSPTFTTGKLRKMDPLIKEAADSLVLHIKKRINECNEVDFAWLFGCYTLDVIASTAFGIKVDSQRDPNDKFVRMASKILAIKVNSPYLTLAFVLPILMRPLSKLFNITVLDKEATEFFTNEILKVLNSSEPSIQKDYVDFIHLMMEAHNEDPDNTDGRRGLTSKEIIANCLLFFFAGYETTAASLSFLAYNLALNPDIQQKMYEEIVSVLGEEEPGYDNTRKLQYMEMCIHETMRMYPASPRTDRICVRETEVKGLKIPEGMQIAVPIYILHHNEKLWQDPEKFDPERFSAENKAKMKPCQFMPFGFGPRICIGKRLAITEMKIALAKLLREFILVKCDKTKIPPKELQTGLIKPEDMWLKVQLRSSEESD